MNNFLKIFFFAASVITLISNGKLFCHTITTTPDIINEPTKEEIINAYKEYDAKNPFVKQAYEKKRILIDRFNKNIKNSKIKHNILPPGQLEQCINLKIIFFAVQLSEILVQSKNLIDFYEKSYAFISKTTKEEKESLYVLIENHKNSNFLYRWWYPLDTKPQESKIEFFIFYATQTWKNLIWSYRIRAVQNAGSWLFDEWISV